MLQSSTHPIELKNDIVLSYASAGYQRKREIEVLDALDVQETVVTG